MHGEEAVYPIVGLLTREFGLVLLSSLFVEQLSNSSSLPIFTPASDLFKVSVMSER